MTIITLPPGVEICQCGDHAWKPLTRGHVVLISPVDAHILGQHLWYAVKRRNVFYAFSWQNVRLHRRVLNAPKRALVDHQNGNGLDNRRSNLRLATYAENAQNGAAHSDSTSKYRGVSWYRPYRKWRAAIYVGKQQKNLGYFKNELDAARAYDAAALRYFGEFARPNF